MAGRYRNARSGDEIEREWKEKDLANKAQEQRDKYMRESYIRVADEARKQNLWIYDPVDKAWYNPDELIATFKWYIAGHEKVMARVQLKDPFEVIETIQVKTNQFIKCVLDYAKKTVADNIQKQDKPIKQRK